MKKAVIWFLIAAQVSSGAASAQAADLANEHRSGETRMGAFAGARLRVSLGGARDSMRAGIMVAPSVHSFGERGAARQRIGEGLEYGFSNRQAPGVSFAGRRISDVSDKRAPEGPRQNVSTLGWVAIGAGAVLVAGAVFMGWLIHEANENSE